ncbi:hypothetical protein ACHAWF_008319 [Thalassiosira exigua]
MSTIFGFYASNWSREVGAPRGSLGISIGPSELMAGIDLVDYFTRRTSCIYIHGLVRLRPMLAIVRSSGFLCCYVGSGGGEVKIDFLLTSPRVLLPRDAQHALSL